MSRPIIYHAVPCLSNEKREKNEIFLYFFDFLSFFTLIHAQNCAQDERSFFSLFLTEVFQICPESIGNDVCAHLESVRPLLFGKSCALPGVADVALMIEDHPSTVVLDPEGAAVVSAVMEETGSAVGEEIGSGIDRVVIGDLDQFMIGQYALHHSSEVMIKITAGIVGKDHTAIFQEIFIQLLDFRGAEVDRTASGQIDKGRFFAFTEAASEFIDRNRFRIISDLESDFIPEIDQHIEVCALPHIPIPAVAGILKTDKADLGIFHTASPAGFPLLLAFAEHRSGRVLGFRCGIQLFQVFLVVQIRDIEDDGCSGIDMMRLR